MLHRLTPILFALLVLSACIPVATETPFVILLPSPTEAVATTTQEPSATETLLPSPTPTETPQPPLPTTAEPLPSVEALPTETFVPLPTLAVQTALPTALPQPDPGSGRIQFFNPGPLSKLVSPFRFYGYAIPGFNDLGRVELFGEDGRLLDVSNIQLNTAYTWAYFNTELEFEVRGAGELGRLSLSTHDEYGRMTALGSVHVLLQPLGYAVVNPPGDLTERCILTLPPTNRRLSGGSLTVAGEIRPYNNLPLVIELIDRRGDVVGSALAAVSPAPDDRYVPFSTTVPYTISSSTWVLITIRHADERIPGTMYLYSREVYLYP